MLEIGTGVVDVGPKLANSVPNLEGAGPKVAEFGSKLVDFGQSRSISSDLVDPRQKPADSGQNMSKLVEFGPRVVHDNTCRANSWV